MAEPIVLERLIDSSPDEAFAMFTDPERLRRWQAISAAVDLRVGGDYRLTLSPGHIATGTFKEIVPGRRLVYSFDWANNDPMGSTVTVEFEPRGSQTLVRFSHDGLTADQASGHTEGWEHFIDRLVDAATTGDAGVDPWAAGPDDPDAFDALVAAEASWELCQNVMRPLAPEHRELPTPCSEYTVHDLVEHLMGSLKGLTAVGGGQVPEAIEADSAEDYIGQAAEIALATWRERGLEGEVPFGESTAPAFVPAGILSLEFLLHAWDFARATDQPIDPSPQLVGFVQRLSEQIITPDNRGDGKGFAQPATPAADDPMTVLAAYTGRVTTG